MNLSKHKLVQGFTLVELAIVLVVIGLIVTGIIAGRQILKSSELRSIITEVDRYTTAVNAFRVQYRGWPGDITNAGSYWPSCDGTPANCNGDGDGKVETGGENLRAWQQLADSDLIKGSYTGTLSGGDIVIGTNVPASDKDRAGYDFIHAAEINNHLRLAEETSGGGTTMTGGALSPEDGFSIDRKLDDGDAGEGKVRGVDSATAGCLSSGDYDTSVTTQICILQFSMN